MYQMYNLALVNIKGLAADRHESKEEFVVRCWLKAIGDVTGIDFNLKHKEDIVIEPD